MYKQLKVRVALNSNTKYLKNFLNKIDLNSVFQQTNCVLKSELKSLELLSHSHDLEIKLSLYKILKTLKALKSMHVTNNSPESLILLNDFSAKLQSSFLYDSIIESEKKKKLIKLKKKIYAYQMLQLKNLLSLELSFNDQSSTLSRDSFYIGFSKYSNRLAKQVNQRSTKKKEDNLLFHYLRTRQFYNKILKSRIYSFLAKGKKKYKKIFVHIGQNRRKMRNFFQFNELSGRNFRIAKKRGFKQFKKLVWKRKRRTKWKKLKLKRFLGMRRKVSFNFSNPHHFEINYKTLNGVYLGYTDLKTINSRIPFWFNLRKLLTFLSS